ncbi:MAG: hypothetical protein L6R40_000995 [Gallowayella cf. fulva]|nr:MAG: hypothetical protein L6R40_000995 [Xanthomendoza cf. fulva]
MEPVNHSCGGMEQLDSHPLPHIIVTPQPSQASTDNQISTLPQSIQTRYRINILSTHTGLISPSISEQYGYMSIENLKTFGESQRLTQDHALPSFELFWMALLSYPFAEADEDTGETKQSQNYIHIRIQQRNGRKTLTTVQGLPKKFDQKKILKVIKKKFACNGTIVNDTEMGEVIQLQGDQRKDVQEFLVDKKEGLALDAKTIKVHGF